ncbi:MAG: hypothetical protein K0Q94_6119, partial [Paenibacillus sp.]|nr:hypothetical protein [Paenibacillus sp.]
MAENMHIIIPRHIHNFLVRHVQHPKPTRVATPFR